MSIVLNTGFSIGSKDLVYDKFVLTKEEMLNIHENTYPDQFFALCSDDDKMYSFNINNTPNAETGKFKVMSGGSTAIDDDNISSTTVYSSEKIDTDFQKITDDNLTTTDKTTTGAINELATRIDEIKITDIIDDTNTEATDKTLSSSKIKSEIQAIIDNTKAANEVEYVNDIVGSYTVEEALNKLISDYYYVKPSINSFTATPNGGIFEVGHVVSAPITFNWSYNKDITTQPLTGCPLADETIRTATYDTDITTNKTFTLQANDGKNNVSKNISYSFTNKVWYGSAAEGTYDDSFILGLSTGKLQTSKSGTYTVTVADREYFFIAMPQSYNNSAELVGKIGGFETGFSKVATINHTNASGYATNYNIYKSTNASLGAISFII